MRREAGCNSPLVGSAAWKSFCTQECKLLREIMMMQEQVESKEMRQFNSVERERPSYSIETKESESERDETRWKGNSLFHSQFVCEKRGELLVREKVPSPGDVARQMRDALSSEFHAEIGGLMWLVLRVIRVHKIWTTYQCMCHVHHWSSHEKAEVHNNTGAELRCTVKVMQQGRPRRTDEEKSARERESKQVFE